MPCQMNKTYLGEAYRMGLVAGMAKQTRVEAHRLDFVSAKADRDYSHCNRSDPKSLSAM